VISLVNMEVSMKIMVQVYAIGVVCQEQFEWEILSKYKAVNQQKSS